jgi:hypothetical protein
MILSRWIGLRGERVLKRDLEKNLDGEHVRIYIGKFFLYFSYIFLFLSRWKEIFWCWHHIFKKLDKISWTYPRNWLQLLDFQQIAAVKLLGAIKPSKLSLATILPLLSSHLLSPVRRPVGCNSIDCCIWSK